MIDRREFVVALGATGLLAACQSGPPKPSVISVNVTGGAGMNPGPGGGDRPVTVLVMRLASTGKFNSTDYFALQGDAGSALGADLIGSDTISVAPGKTAAKTITVEPNATALGFVALIREPGGRNWRTTKSVSPGSKFTINVSLGKGGISA
ncbi:type VI secretion protein [Mesorhizobium sp. LNHC221B00]|uniref:type VI secretion system lipoprotein TssJ n=1 Tax=Mesorhizobium sp. LNHC221B00 TaxID=1287233 RepID=UPI0003CEA496|nr:type VI secretion system lipoprotein TssJ [Mesorhizobium sp. LNHC221B00]ESY74134.1 type VI secretion protein [Mesorhizobium sp. LNHC221B00]